MLFYKRFTEVLNQSKYSQKELAELLNISESNITHWKNGANLPSVDILYKLCVIFEESADYLLGLEDEGGTKIYKK